MAERVATERGEKVGQTVGFQIRLESRVSPRTLLTFCTNGVLLRTLMGSGPNSQGLSQDQYFETSIYSQTGTLSSLSTVTHIIIDEVHERDRFSDFLLTVLRDALVSYTSLKLIIMSATIDVEKFMDYFVNAHHIDVPGKIHPVNELYLEDVLLQINYSTPIMDKEKKALISNNTRHNEGECTSEKTYRTHDTSLENNTKIKIAGIDKFTTLEEMELVEIDEDIIIEMDEESKEEMDNVLSEAFMSNSNRSFQRLMELVQNNGSTYVSIDYMHSKTGVNTLMCAATHGKIDMIEHLLITGADPSLKATNGWTAQDFAMKMGNDIAANIIASFQNSLASLVVGTCSHEKPYATTQNASEDLTLATKTFEQLKLGQDNSPIYIQRSDLENPGEQELRDKKEAVLRAYHKSFDEDSERGVDKSLIVSLVKFIVKMKNMQIANDNYNGSILIFLPGYEDIIGVNDLLKYDTSLLVLMLHSQMVSLDQKKVFRPPPSGMTKVILSTNIAETSITINDVCHVIDTGKVKEKNYDSISGVTMLMVTWISQNSATQRKGRAGRTQPGTCYRLFSSNRYSSMLKSSVPEILRTPLMELCLATKLLTPFGTPIADFLARAPDPPSLSATRTAVQDLKQIEAIDEWEDVTELGNHLLDLPIEPKLGKTVLYAVVLKCLDPILTIVCCVSYKDPFVLSSNPTLKKAAKAARQTFSGDSMSDHMALLRVFQGWQKARVEGNEKSFCYRYQVSSSTMEMITGMRTQLLGQLRASGFVRAKGYGDIRDLNRHSENWAVVKAALIGGAYPCLARFEKESKLLRTSKESKVRLHPNAVLLNSSDFNKKPKLSSTSSINNQKILEAISADWFMFDEMTRAGRLALIRGVTVVTPITVALFAGPNRILTSKNETNDNFPSLSINTMNVGDSDSDCEAEDNVEANIGILRLDDWISFRTDKPLLDIIIQLRQKWSALFLRRLNCAGKPMTQVDDSIVQTLVNILTAEESALGLNQPIGIGQRPKTIPPPESSNSYSPRKTNMRSGNASYNQKLTYKNAPTELGQFRTIGQPSPLISENKACERSSAQSFNSFRDNAEKVDASTKYFVIKATNSNALQFSLSKGLWQFGNQTERRLMKCIKAGYSVILIFSIQGSSHFQGFALFSGTVSQERFSELQSQGQGSGSGSQYFIDWIKKGNIPFQATKNLINLYNDRKKVQTSRDGQELDPSLGNTLCKMWERVQNNAKEMCKYEIPQDLVGVGQPGRENYYSGGNSKSSRRIAGRYVRH